MPGTYSEGQNVARLILLVIGFLCFFILSTQRMNLTIGMLCMVNWSEVKTANFCSTINEKPGNSLNDTVEPPDIVPVGEFSWSISLQSIIHVSYFFGLLLSYLPAEKLLVENFSSKYLVLIGMFLSSTCDLITPKAARLHVAGLILARIIQAMGHVIILLSFSVLLGKWIPAKHLVSSMCLATSGLPFGAFFIVILSGVICNEPYYSWPFVFYLTGSFGIIWCLIWLYFCFDIHFVPVLIGSYTNPNPEFPKRSIPVPYSAILTSPPFWSYVASGIAAYWILAMNMFIVPIYFRNVFNTSVEWGLFTFVYALCVSFSWILIPDVQDKEVVLMLIVTLTNIVYNSNQKTGELSSFPNALQAFLYIFSFTLLTKKFGSKTGRRQVCTCLGIFIFAACMVLLSFVRCTRPLGALLMVVGIGFSGFTQAAISLIAVDMSPNFCGTLSGIMNTVGAAVGSFLPITVALLTGGEANIRDWEKVFYVSFFVTFISMILFMGFSSCDIQPWNEPYKTLMADLALQLKSDSSLDEILPLRQDLKQAALPSSNSKSNTSVIKKCN